MAGDWLKIEKDTPEKPEVFAISEKLRISVGDAFLGCFRLWRWADTHTSDGSVPNLPAEAIDTVTRLPGFSQALVAVGWLQVESGTLTLPNFDRHMGQSAKKRVYGAERQRRFRSQDGNASVTRRRDSIPRGLRREVYARDNNTCVYCGFVKGTRTPYGAYLGAVISLDHVLPVTRGGATTLDNLVTSCTVCNNKKNNRTPEEAGMIIRRRVTTQRDESVTEALPEKRREEKITEDTPSECCPEPAEPASEPPPSSPVVMVFPTVGNGRSGWPLTEAKVTEYRQTYPGVDVPAECRRAWQWCQDNPTRRKTVKGMPAFLARWLGKAQDRGPPLAGGGKAASLKGMFEDLP